MFGRKEDHKMAVTIMEAKEEFLALEKEILREAGTSIKFDLTNDEQIDLFIITEMYRIDKDFTNYIRKALNMYMKAWKENH